MRFWTAHLRPGAAPLLVRESFSWGALIFGPLWLAAHRAWIPAALSLAASVLILALVPSPYAAVLFFTLAVVLGQCGHDLRRWSIDHRGFTLVQVVAAPSEIEAMSVLLSRRPDLASSFLPPQAAR